MTRLPTRPGKRAVFYARVSTTRQAEGELSIPDQIRQGEAHCLQKGWTLVETMIEPGASATDDRRPEFQRMIERATSPARPFDVVLVHSMSRFFRDQFQSELYRRRLRKAGVEVLSVTQDFADDPTGNLIRQVMGSFDEYQSRENAKHTLRAMQENARQGFWNGSIPPFGYATEAAGQRGARTKKVLVINEAEAPVVRRMFDLALGRHGPALGVKAIASLLNGEGVSYRGKPFHISNVYMVLTTTTYAGDHYFNQRDSKTQKIKPQDQWVPMQVPAIVSRDDFDRVQAHLKARSPARVAPRMVNNPTLLTGIAVCATCGRGMTMRTGKSSRHGYRYYTCAARAQKGATACPGRTVRMPDLDRVVLNAIAARLLTTERLTELLQSYVERSATADAIRRDRLGQARRRLTDLRGAIQRLMAMVEAGTIEAEDPDLRERMGMLKAQRFAAEEEIKTLEVAGSQGEGAITPDRINRFRGALADVLTSGQPEFRKAYLRLFVDRVIVGDDSITITGPTGSLARAAMLGTLPPTATEVRTFVREWRAREDSNSQPSDP